MPAYAKVRVEQAHAAASVVLTRDGYTNAIQVWPLSDGALYQVDTSPSRVTVISLQPAEQLGPAPNDLPSLIGVEVPLTGPRGMLPSCGSTTCSPTDGRKSCRQSVTRADDVRP